MTEAKLVILRHGQTDYNKEHRMTGQLDVPLNAEGEEQAREAGTLIRDIRFDKVYSSTLSRAFNTAAIALKSAGTEQQLQNPDGSFQIEQRREIIELDNGDLTGHSRFTDPALVNRKIIYDVPCPNGESLKQLVERVQKFYVAEVQPRLERGENVLIVTHSAVTQAFEVVLGVAAVPEPGSGVAKEKVLNAAPAVYTFDGGKMTGIARLTNPETARAANQNTAPPRKAINTAPK